MRWIVLTGCLAASPASALDRAYHVKPFDTVVNASTIRIVVRDGAPTRVVAAGSRTALATLDVRVASGVLRITDRPGARPRGPVRITVTTPRLREVVVAGRGGVTVGRARGRAFDAAVEASGDLDISGLVADRVRLRVAGPGALRAAGRCSGALLIAEGAGRLDAAGLRCARVSASVSASGDLAGFASERAALALSGSGDARVEGGAQCRIMRSGSGVGRCPG